MGKPNPRKRNKVIPHGPFKDKRVRDLSIAQLRVLLDDENISKALHGAATSELRYKLSLLGDWRDVLHPKKEKKSEPPRVNAVCSNCGHQTNMRRSFLRAKTKPRCTMCGGPMNSPREA